MSDEIQVFEVVESPNKKRIQEDLWHHLVTTSRMTT